MSKTTNKSSPEVRSCAVRLVLDHEHQHSSRRAAIMSVASKIGCTAQSRVGRICDDIKVRGGQAGHSYLPMHLNSNSFTGSVLRGHDFELRPNETAIAYRRNIFEPVPFKERNLERFSYP